MESGSRAPLIITADEQLVDTLLRASAAAGLTPDVLGDPIAAMADWSVAPLILIGTDRVSELARIGPDRREHVYVVHRGPDGPPPSLFRDALACSADAVLELPADHARLVELLADAADGDSSFGVLVGVIGGAGGAGATTFAAALAQRFARDRSVLLVDADPLGGGIEQVLGSGASDGAQWDSLAQADGRLSVRSLRETLPEVGGVAVLGWPGDRAFELTPTTVRSTLAVAQRGYRAVVVDLPRSPSAVVDEVVRRCDHLVLVCTLTVPALAAAIALSRRLPASRSALLLRGPGGISNADVERLLGIAVWHRMPDQPRLDESISLGLGPLRSRRGPLARATREIARKVSDLGAS